MDSVFLGDSFTAEEANNWSSFVNYMPGVVHNVGISGTTMGEYSIYPVDGNSLVSMVYKQSSFIKRADVIFIEYGINDTSAIMCGFSDIRKCVVSFVKAIDAIKQINPRAKIYFLSLSNRSDIIHLFANAQCKYLEEEYFGGYNFSFPVSKWRETYLQLISYIERKVDTIPMFDSIDWDTEIGEDGLHPNDLGYQNIANNIVKYM